MGHAGAHASSTWTAYWGVIFKKGEGSPAFHAVQVVWGQVQVCPGLEATWGWCEGPEMRLTPHPQAHVLWVLDAAAPSIRQGCPPRPAAKLSNLGGCHLYALCSFLAPHLPANQLTCWGMDMASASIFRGGVPPAKGRAWSGGWCFLLTP